MSARQLVAALLVAAAAAAAPAAAAAGPGQAAQPAEVHNVLERFPTAQLRWDDTLGSASRSRGIKISYNVTELRASGDWVSALATSVQAICLLPSPSLSTVILHLRLFLPPIPLPSPPPPTPSPHRWRSPGRACATLSPATCWRCTRRRMPTSSTRHLSSLSMPAMLRATCAAAPAACRCAWSTCAGVGPGCEVVGGKPGAQLRIARTLLWHGHQKQPWFVF